MTNKERQASLEKKMGDNVGQMPQCLSCRECICILNYGHYGCWADKHTRMQQCLCAKAYNRMVREKPKITTTEKDRK